MTERDKRVGQAIVALRGDTSQAAVADAMRERGWKWSQATVWSVEKGERPLRLLEAGDLADVLGIQIDDFLGDRAAARREAEFKRIRGLIFREFGEITLATYRLLAAQDELKDWADNNGVRIPQDYEEAKGYGKGSRERDIHYSLTVKDPMEAVRKGEEAHERNKQVSPNPHGEHREVQDGEHPEER